MPLAAGMDDTSVRGAMERAEQERRESRVHRMHKRFRERWAPENDRHEFEADLAMLMQEVAIYALKPFQDAAAHQLASRPMPPVFIKDKEGQSDG